MPAKVDPGLSRVATEARTGGAGGKGAVLAYPKRSSGADPEVLAVFQEELARSAATPAFMHAGRPLWARFIRYYQGLARLPRRARRALQRRWRRSLPAIALLCALGQAPALAATLTVEPGIAPDIGPDGSCSLIEAIENANADARTHADCPSGNGADTIVLPSGSAQTLTRVHTGSIGLPVISSTITVEGHGSTITRNTGAPVSPLFSIFDVISTGNLTLNETTVSGGLRTETAGGVSTTPAS